MRHGATQAVADPGVMRATATDLAATEGPGRRTEQMLQHPAQPLSMGPGPTGLAFVAMVAAVAVRKWRKRGTPAAGA